MIPTLINLQVRSACQRNLNLDQNFTLCHSRNRHFLNLHVLFAVEDGCCHMSVHYESFHSLPHRITSFMVSRWGCAATLRPSTASARGKRCVTSPARSAARLNTQFVDSCCRSTEAL